MNAQSGSQADRLMQSRCIRPQVYGKWFMKITQDRQWILLVGLTLFGIVAFALFALFAVLFISPAADPRDYYAGVVGFLEEAPPLERGDHGRSAAGVIGKTLTLKKGEKAALGDVVLVYVGFSGEAHFELDVLVPELDPESPYRYRFSIDAAEEGFEVANRRFQLLAARRSFLHLLLLDG
jgi:hypothetical protein